MGRYYSGDIEGKFLFSIQSSDVADRFGVVGQSPATLIYSFGTEDLENVENELRKIIKKFGAKFFKIRKFYSRNFNCESLNKEIKHDDLSEFADLKLGFQIRRCLKLNNYCEFEAEL